MRAVRATDSRRTNRDRAEKDAAGRGMNSAVKEETVRTVSSVVREETAGREESTRTVSSAEREENTRTASSAEREEKARRETTVRTANSTVKEGNTETEGSAVREESTRTANSTEREEKARREATVRTAKEGNTETEDSAVREESTRMASDATEEENTRTVSGATREESTRTASGATREENTRTASGAMREESTRTASSVVREETVRRADSAGITGTASGTGIVRRAIRDSMAAADTIKVRITDRDRKDSQDTMTISLKDNERVDELQRNGYRIIQNPEKFCFGMDAVLLTGFARARQEDRLLDLGTGTGIIPLLMEAKYHCAHLTGLEIQPESADMAARSVELNGLTDKIDIVTGDIKEADNIFQSASFDCITCNPPYMIGRHGIVNPDAPKAVARHELLCTFEDVAAQTGKLLKPGGHFFLVHRPFRLAEIMTTLVRFQLEPKRMQLVYPYVDKEPNMVLIEAVRGGRSRMNVEKPLIVYREPGVYMPEIYEIYGY